MDLGSNFRMLLDKMHYRPKKKVSMSASRLTLNPNEFLGPDIVFYYAEKQHPVVVKYLSDHHKRIDTSLREKGMRFIFLPKSQAEVDPKRIKELSDFVDYAYPGLLGDDHARLGDLVQGLLGGKDSGNIQKHLKAALAIPDQNHPALVHRIHSETDSNLNAQFVYSFAFLDPGNRRAIHAQIEQYLHRVRYSHDQVFFQLAESNDEYDADDRFDLDGSLVSDEVRSAIHSLKEIDNEKILISSVLYILRSLKDAHPDIAGKLAAILEHPSLKETPKLSRLLIDDHFRIILPEFNREIELTPLPKSFYLFMLRHPEGVLFRDLRKHRNELIDIYGKVGNRLERTAIESSIDDLIDYKSNSVNEKCSRIKEGFLKKLDNRIAGNYYITGDRNNLKKVILETGLISLPKGF